MENKVVTLTRWNSQVCSEKSEWFAENVKGLDQTVEEMVRMVEQDDGESPKQSELIARIREISERHHLLSDHYNKLTGELKGYYLQPENAMKKATFDPQETPPFLTPKKTLSMLYSDNETPGFDLSPSSGGVSSDTTRSESSLLSSDSDSESCNSSLPKMADHNKQEQKQEQSCASHEGECGKCGMLLRQISDYVKELEVSTDKLRFAEEEIFKLKNELQNNAAVMVNLGSLELLLAAAKSEIKLHEAEVEEENRRSLVLQRQVADLEVQLKLEQRRTAELQASVENYVTDLSNRKADIRRLTSELQDASGNFALEKWQLESSVAKLSERLKSQETRAKELQAEHDLLTDVIKKYEAEKIKMEEKQETTRINWRDDMMNKNAIVDALNKSLDAVMVEKDEVRAKLGKANAEISHRDDQIRCLEGNVHELCCENKRVSAGKDSAEKEIMELKLRIEVLEKELGLQVTKTDDVAEEKREAIRQLCFSIEHFRSAYEEVCNAYVSRVGSRAVAV